MLLQILVAMALLHEPPVQTVAAPAGQEAAPATAAAPAPRTRRERRAELVCENRAPTGSVMSRRVCRTPRRAENERAAAQVYVGQVTAGTLNEPPPQ